MYVGENVGRDAQAKAARKLAADSDKALQWLLSRDNEGTKALISAREFAKKQAEAMKVEGKQKGKEKGKGKEGVMGSGMAATLLERLEAEKRVFLLERGRHGSSAATSASTSASDSR